MIFTDWPWLYWAKEQPDAVAIREDNNLISWQRLSDHIEIKANFFFNQGVREGHTVALRGKNSLTLLLNQLALLRCGAKILPLNPALPELLLSQLLPQLALDFYLECHSESLLSLPLSIIRLNDYQTSINNTIFVDNTSYIDNVDDHSFTYNDIDDSRNGIAEIKWSAQRLATLILTSGSTGLPKAVVHSFAAHLSSAQDLLSAMTFESNDSWLLSLPLFHVSGQGITWRWLLRGALLVMRGQSSLEDALKICTHASLVPTQLWRLLAQNNVNKLKLKQVLLGGAMIPLTLTSRAQQQGIECWCGYGMTEFASTVCAKRANGKSGVGLALGDKKVTIIDDEIYVKGNSIASGYWLQGQLKPLQLTANSYYGTRDRGRFDEGELQIIGRLDNLFFCGGESVQPEDIERVLQQHDFISQAIVLPMDCPEFGQKPVAVIDIDQPLTDALIESLKQWCATRLAIFQQPTDYYVLPSELKAGGIKLSRHQISQWLINRINNC